jgi:hypothetical protein
MLPIYIFLVSHFEGPKLGNYLHIIAWYEWLFLFKGGRSVGVTYHPCCYISNVNFGYQWVCAKIHEIQIQCVYFFKGWQLDFY